MLSRNGNYSTRDFVTTPFTSRDVTCKIVFILLQNAGARRRCTVWVSFRFKGSVSRLGKVFTGLPDAEQIEINKRFIKRLRLFHYTLRVMCLRAGQLVN